MNVVIVGAGVAGLTSACVLREAGLSVSVLEAAAQVGGRVRSMRDATGNHLGDLGPSWVWPPFQLQLSAWLDKLELSTFEQYEKGDGCVERAQSQAVQHLALPAQHGQHRPLGGPTAIINALLERLPDNTVQLNKQVLSVVSTPEKLVMETADGDKQPADHVLIAAPLRIVDRDIRFDPPLNDNICSVLAASPTWMAAQAKALVVYETPFWRERGFSGRIASSIGPLVEAHDHSGIDGLPAALVGFIGLDAAARSAVARNHGPEALQSAVIEQLVRCFGPQAHQPSSIRIEDWANEPYITTQKDRDHPGDHPAVLSELVRQPYCDNRLHFCVSETATLSPGLLEGAMLAGQQAAEKALEALARP